MSYTPIRRHVKILQPAHPYDRKYDEYFEKRTSEKWKNNSQRLSIESYINMIQLQFSQAGIIIEFFPDKNELLLHQGGGSYTFTREK